MVKTMDLDRLYRVAELIDLGSDEPLAPFALRPDKEHLFSADGRAAIGYRVRCGLMVAGGDPVGDLLSWPDVIQEFVSQAKAQGHDIAVLGASERSRDLWVRYAGLADIPIGRDTVIDVNSFTLTGRRFRNLRQAVSRTHNAGVSTELVSSAEVSAPVRLEVERLFADAGRDHSRGFSMILGDPFAAEAPESLLALARDRDGRLVAAQRYLWAGYKDLSLDVPTRSAGAPNGVDERLVIDLIDWAATHGVARISLSFAPFPDLFSRSLHADTMIGRLGIAVARRVVHVLDPLIKVERLYRYLRKFHSFDRQRYVLLRPHRIARTAAALLLLEFLGRGHRRGRPHRSGLRTR